jgi:outer membrane receptor for ferrienterochelin and colicins
MKKIVFWLMTGLILLPLDAGADELLARAGDTSKSSRMNEVVVTATKTEHKLSESPIDTVLITREEIERSNAQSVAELLRYVPGFNFSQQSDLMSAMGYKNTVRGLNVEDRYLLVLVDGQRVFTGYRSGGMASYGFSHNVNVVPVGLIERIEIVKGAGSALYGSDAVVGVLNIITRTPPKEAMAQAGGGYGWYEVKGMDYLGTTPKDTSRIRYNAYATAGGAVTPNLRAIFNVSREYNEGIHEVKYDVQRDTVYGVVDWDIIDGLALRVGGDFSLWEEVDSDVTDQKEESAPRIYGILSYSLNENHNFKLRAYRQAMNEEFHTTTYGNSESSHYYLDFEAQYSGRWLDFNTISLGAESLTENYHCTGISEKSITTYSLYLQDEIKLINGRLALIPGIRFDDNETYGQELNPKLSVMFEITPQTVLRASVGRSFKAPTALQTLASPFNHVTFYVDSNPDLKPESSINWQASIEQSFFKDQVTISCTYFHMDLEDMITQVSTGEIRNGLSVLTYENIGEAEIQGVEASLIWEVIDGLNLMLGYTYTDAENKKTESRLVDTPENSFQAQIDYRNDEYKFGGYASFTYDSEQENTIYTSSSSPVTDSFTTVNLNLWKEVFDHAKLSVQVNNLLDEDLIGSDTIYEGRSFWLMLSTWF